MSFSDHFSSVAAHYAAYRPGYPPELFAWLADLVPSHEVAWDCACGSGQAAQGLTVHFKSIIATDASAEQIKEAKLNPKITYSVALAEQSGLDAHSVDLITVAQAAHWFKHDAFYKEVRRVLKPRGILALWTYEFFSIDDRDINNCIRTFYEKAINPYWPAERAWVKAHYKTLPFALEDEIKAPAFEQSLSWNFTQLFGYFRSWSAVKKFEEVHGFDLVEKLERDLKPLWGDPNSTKPITMPLYMRVARV
jgi:ubiquinone/menaquinone biosynthesis C-methylase UbiE